MGERKDALPTALRDPEALARRIAEAGGEALAAATAKHAEARAALVEQLSPAQRALFEEAERAEEEAHADRLVEVMTSALAEGVELGKQIRRPEGSDGLDDRAATALLQQAFLKAGMRPEAAEVQIAALLHALRETGARVADREPEN